MQRILLSLMIFGVVSGGAFAQTRATRTITNADLEKYRLEREKNEAQEDVYRKQNGLPSRAEQAKINIREQAESSAYSRQISAQRQQNEAYWRNRGAILRTEIVSVNAEINYLVSQINRLPNRQGVYAIGYAAPQYYPNQFPVYQPQPRLARSPNSQSARNFPTQSLPPNNNSVSINFGRGYGQINYGNNYYPNYGAPIFVQNQSSERQDLISRLRYLEQQRAGLNARWDELENEARQNGADFGWLR